MGAAAELSDAELLAIARGADPLALLGAERASTPPSPPVEREQGLRRGDEGGHAPGDIPVGSYPAVRSDWGGTELQLIEDGQVVRSTRLATVAADGKVWLGKPWGEPAPETEGGV